MAKRQPQKVSVELDLGSFTFQPAKRREDGGMKSGPTMLLKATHRDKPVRELMEFLQVASGPLKITVDAENLVPDLEAWDGFCTLKGAKWTPPGPRSEEQGDDVHPTVELGLEIVAGQATDLHGLMGLRLDMDDAGAFVAKVSLQVWQEDLPWQDRTDDEGDGD